MAITNEKKQLIEEIGLGIEERLSISPLAGRIYALLILSSYEGLTFEEIRDYMQASKSSISVNINVLTQLGYVTYHTKPGDRKRYFKITKYYQIQSLELYLQSLKKEMTIVQKINSYNSEHHPEKFSAEESLGEISQDYLLKFQKLIKDTIQKITELRKNDHTH